MHAEAHQEYMYGFIASVLQTIGPRESCSENERRLGQRLAELWRALGHEVRVERFTCHPKAFLGFIPFSALLYLGATVCYWVAPFLCFLLAAISFAAIVLELLRYREFVDPLFPAADGENVVAVIRPRGTVERRVIVSAHQDSAYEFNLWFLLKTAGAVLMFVAFAAVLVPLVGGFAKCVAGSPANAPVFDVIGYVCIGLYPLVGLNLFFHTYSVVPGAMDDLAGISILAGTAKALADARDAQAAPALEHTEVVVLAAAAEEAGLRGAKRYVEAHAHELKALPTYGIFIDGVYDERYLTVVDRELTTGTHHDPALVTLAKDVAAQHGWSILQRMVPFGATDASAFSLAGIRSVLLLCQDISRLVPHYHTRLDTIDRVRPQSLSVTLQMVLDMIRHIDAHGL
jgi:peptidase M28-like protein